VKAITLTEPWASLVSIGAKRIETRSWATSYRGPIAIHASKKLTRHDADIMTTDQILDVLVAAGINPHAGTIGPGYLHNVSDKHDVRSCPLTQLMQVSRGAVIATAQLIDCFQFTRAHPGSPLANEVYHRPSGRVEITTQEYRLGDFTPGRYGFVLTDVVRLPEPIKAQGDLGLWDWDSP
jgi:hypothetical protein